MSFIITRTGQKFDFESFIAEDIKIVDVGAALSKLCRFTGHTTKFYSVAEHSLLVSQLVQLNGGDVRTQLWGLLHDAPEAYIGDMSTPLKDYLGQTLVDWHELHTMLMIGLCRRLGLPDQQPDLVTRCDYAAYCIEFGELFPRTQAVAETDKRNKESHLLENLTLLDPKRALTCWHPAYVETRFLDRFRALKREHDRNLEIEKRLREEAGPSEPQDAVRQSLARLRREDQDQS